MKSVNWKMWKAVLDFRICLDCKDLHGKIYEFWEKEYTGTKINIYRKSQGVFGMKQIFIIAGDSEAMTGFYIPMMV